MCGSTCFGLLSAHHQERTTALGASGITVRERRRLEPCWSWSGRFLHYRMMMHGLANVKWIRVSSLMKAVNKSFIREYRILWHCTQFCYRPDSSVSGEQNSKLKLINWRFWFWLTGINKGHWLLCVSLIFFCFFFVFRSIRKITIKNH
jgi:hypothetical protein